MYRIGYKSYSGFQNDTPVTKCSYVQMDITEENREKVDAINLDGTRYIAEAAKATNAKFLYLSTDYVFDGKGERH